MQNFSSYHLLGAFVRLSLREFAHFALPLFIDIQTFNVCNNMLSFNMKYFVHFIPFQLAQEAFKCEEKEEKLVKDAVQHLTQANIQIKDLHHQFTHKVIRCTSQYLKDVLSCNYSRLMNLPNNEKRLIVYSPKFVICKRDFRTIVMKMMISHQILEYTR